MTKVYDHVDQLSPELVGTVITFKIVQEKNTNPTSVVSHIVGKLICYATAEGQHTKGRAGVSKAYQVLLEGYPVITVDSYEFLED